MSSLVRTLACRILKSEPTSSTLLRSDLEKKVAAQSSMYRRAPDSRQQAATG